MEEARLDVTLNPQYKHAAGRARRRNAGGTCTDLSTQGGRREGAQVSGWD